MLLLPTPAVASSSTFCPTAPPAPTRYSTICPKQIYEARDANKSAVPEHCLPTFADAIDVWVVSAGGVGSNTVHEWLRKVGIRIGSTGLWSAYSGHLCHALTPQSGIEAWERQSLRSVKRALFLYTEPCDQVHSLYRQGYAMSNLLKKLGIWDKLSQRTTSRDRQAALGAIGKAMVPRTFGEFVREGQDTMLMEAQWLAWTAHSGVSTVAVDEHPLSEAIAASELRLPGRTKQVHFPIMALHMDALWRRLPEVLTFLGLPEDAASLLPPQRNRTRSKSSADKEALDACYQSPLFSSLRDRMRRSEQEGA